MLQSNLAEAKTTPPLRLWPGLVLATIMFLLWFVIPAFVPGAAIAGLIGAVIGALLILLWWLGFSRAPWSERIGALVLLIFGTLITSRFIHPSIATAGQSRLFYILALPTFCFALALGAALSRRFATGARRVTMAATILLACSFWTLLRTGGITGEAESDFHWRWTKTPEEQLLAQSLHEPAPIVPPEPIAPTRDTTRAPEKALAPAIAPNAAVVKRVAEKRQAPLAPAATSLATQAEAEWPGFRGALRDGVQHHTQLATDWNAAPPVELWRKAIGPGWASFAVHGERFYTQEQRGEEELVVCYNLRNGEPVWLHRDSTRFWESNGGAGPRATPTLHDDRVYTFGATGIVNALHENDGSVIWSRNASMDANKKIPMWGFAGSPLVHEEQVIIAAGGKLVAYDLATGTPRWFGPDSGWGYSSPHLLTIAGEAQIVLLNGAGAIGVARNDGAVLWQHHWPGDGIVQPALTANGELLIGTGSGLGDNAGIGVRCLALTHNAAGWQAAERWTSNGLKPYFNDFVVHDGHAFGFDGSILACIDLQDGKRKWKGGRYGHGQLVLLPEQDLLLVLSEQGEIALVRAATEQFTELARMPALKGKTWNHPVLVGDILLVRNGQEMVAYRLARAGV